MNAFNPYLADVYASMQPPMASPALGPVGQPPMPPPPMPAEASFPPAAPPPPPPMTTAPSPGPVNNPFALPAGGLDAPIKAPSLPSVPTPASQPLEADAPAVGATPQASPGGGGGVSRIPGGWVGGINSALNAPEDPNAFPLQASSGGGVTPAHEVETRGPSLLAAQGNANAATAGAIDSVVGRSTDTAANDYAMALQQERSARLREDAMQQSMAEREEEMATRQADFDQSVKQLSQMSMDPNHFWATRSTGQKVGALVGLALGGFLQGARGGSNPGLDAINTAIDRDVRAQEAAWHIQRDVVSGRQTAFGLAMQKYQNVDAARSMARAAALDAVQGQMQQSQALWKGTDAANRADVAMAALQQDKMNQTAQGIRFILPQAQGRTWTDKRTGITYNEAQAREFAKEHRGYEQGRELVGLNTAGDIMKEDVKAGHAATKVGKEHPVVLPTGETVFAPDPTEAGKLRELSMATQATMRLIKEAKEIRGDSTTGVPLSPAARGRLGQIQKDLVTNFAVQHNLGALSKDDLELAVGGTADLFQYGPGVNSRLDRLGETSSAKLADRVKSYPGAPPKASGQMPASGQQHGGK